MRKSLVINEVNLRAVLYTICAYIIIWAPYQADNPMYMSEMASILKYFQYGVFLIVLLMYFRERKTILNTSTLVAFLGCAFSITLPWIYDYNGQGSSGILSLILIFVFLIDDEGCQALSFRYFRNVWTVLSALGIIFYIANSLSIPIPHSTYKYYGRELVGISQEYNSYGIIYIYKGNLITRLCGICNEPGWWGTVSALLLCTDRLDMHKKSNWIIGIAGILTVSLAFVLIVFIYILCLVRKNKKIFLLLLIIFILYFFVIPNLQTGIVEIDELITRIRITETGLVGDNRSNAVLDNLVRKMIYERPIWGYGSGYASAYTTNSSSYKMMLVDYGLVGCFIMYGLLLYSAIVFANHDLYCILYIIPYFANIYQRPNIFSLTYILLLFGGIQHIRENNNASVSSYESEG